MRLALALPVLAASAVSAVVLAAAPAAAAEGPTFPTRDARCTVPTVLFPAAAVVDPDSLEGCGYFEDPRYHDNRRAAGTYTDQGLFSRVFG